MADVYELSSQDLVSATIASILFSNGTNCVQFQQKTLPYFITPNINVSITSTQVNVFISGLLLFNYQQVITKNYQVKAFIYFYSFFYSPLFRMKSDTVPIGSVAPDFWQRGTRTGIEVTKTRILLVNTCGTHQYSSRINPKRELQKGPTTTFIRRAKHSVLRTHFCR